MPLLALLCSILFGNLKLYSTLQLIVMTCKLGFFFHYSLLLLNDLNILNTFDKLAEVYRLNSWSFSCEGLLVMSNDAANLQLLGPGMCCSNAGDRGPARVGEVLLYGCRSNICYCSKCQCKAEEKGAETGLDQEKLSHAPACFLWVSHRPFITQFYFSLVVTYFLKGRACCWFSS